MKVLIADLVAAPCMLATIRKAGDEMGKLAGVEVRYGTKAVSGVETLSIRPGEVLVVPVPQLPAGVAAQALPQLKSGGWISSALVVYSDSASCDEDWVRILKHELGHVFGLRDTRDMKGALMHWQGSFGELLRPWELAHLRRRIVNQ
jgi:hypothetical protein